MDALAKNESTPRRLRPCSWLSPVHPDAHVRRSPAFEDTRPLTECRCWEVSPYERSGGLDAAEHCCQRRPPRIYAQ